MSTAVYDDPRLLAPPATVKTLLPDGGFVLRSPEPLVATPSAAFPP